MTDTVQAPTVPDYRGFLLVPIDGGFRVRDSADGRYHIDVLRMLYNWRVVTTPVDCPGIWLRGWCYYGHGFDRDGNARTMTTAFHAAVAAAWAWDGADGTAPADHDKPVGAW